MYPQGASKKCLDLLSQKDLNKADVYEVCIDGVTLWRSIVFKTGEKDMASVKIKQDHT